MPYRNILWFPLALLAAMAFAAHNGMSKRALRAISPLQLAFGAYLIYSAVAGVLFLAALLISGPGILAAQRGFLTAIGITSALNAAAIILLFEGIGSAPLSESIPFLSLTPVFIVLTGWILLGERLSLAGIAAIAGVAAGSYLLQSRDGSEGFFAAWRRVLASPGPRNVLAVALIFSVSAVVDKMALLRGNLILFLFAASWFRTALIGVAVLALGRKAPSLEAIRGPCLAVGSLFAFEGLVHMAAVGIGPVAYVVAVKRTSVLFSALLGFYAFGERRSLRIVAGIVMMVAGAAALSVV